MKALFIRFDMIKAQSIVRTFGCNMKWVVWRLKYVFN